MGRVALYARVSTNKDQSVETQLFALRDWAVARGHEVVAEYADEGISGAKGRDKRPALDAMMKDAARGKFDMVAATALDRLGRSLQHLVGMVAELDALRVGLFVQNMAWIRPRRWGA
ncbi:recombinase family protein [Stenotrophomonas muris]|uniref:recombinase family protein n=1 Tax=Stenotrophomonas muris TaxID=2963283 RepID=UPI002E7782C2|nr:recombinase family protein [Stenotrophomonas muris]